MSKSLVSRILASSIALTPIQLAHAKDPCFKGFMGIDMRVTPAEGLKKYAKTAPIKEQEVSDALEGINRLPFGVGVVGLEFSCMEPSRTLFVRAQYAGISSFPVQSIIQGDEKVNISQHERGRKITDGFLGLGWGAGATYHHASLEFGYRVHPHLGLTISSGYSTLKAKATVDADDLKLRVIMPYIDNLRYTKDLDIRAVELTEKGEGFTIGLSAIATSVDTEGNKGNIELVVGGMFQQILMQRRLDILPENQKDVARLHRLTTEVAHATGRTAPEEKPYTWHDVGVLNVHATVYVGLRWIFPRKINTTKIYKEKGQNIHYGTKPLEFMDQLQTWE